MIYDIFISLILSHTLFFLILFSPFITPAVLLVVGAVKRRKNLVISCSAIIVVEILLIIAFNIIFPTSYPYVDKWIKGKTQAEIVSVYGEPDIIRSPCIGYESYNQLFSPYREEYYYIYFDENGIAESFDKSCPIGG